MFQCGGCFWRSLAGMVSFSLLMFMSADGGILGILMFSLLRVRRISAERMVPLLSWRFIDSVALRVMVELW